MRFEVIKTDDNKYSLWPVHVRQNLKAYLNNNIRFRFFFFLEQGS